jgi:hypothetical protein
MVTAKLRIGQLIDSHVMFQIDGEEGDWFVYYYAPDGQTMYKIKLDDASKAAIKAKRDQVVAFLSGEITLSGSVEETQKLQDVIVPASTVKQWVKQ